MGHSNGLSTDHPESSDSPMRLPLGTGLPNIIAIGPPRTATTWMHRVLKDRINLPASVKETRFFDLRYGNGLSWYQAHFRDARAGRPTAEIAPTYFYSADARFRIAERLPGVRIVVTLREPVERLFSLYKLRRASGKVTDAFELAIETDDELRESSRYRHHLAEWISMFGRSRTLILIYENLVTEPQNFVDQLCDFIGISHFELTAESLVKENSTQGAVAPTRAWWTRLGVTASEWMRSNRYDRTMALVRATGVRNFFLDSKGNEMAPLDPSLASTLRARLRPEVEAVEKIIGRELLAWRSAV